MMRKLAVALSLVSVLGAGVVQALGLGEASVESTLNQPLKAEIELVNIRDLEDNEILPGLASREEFLKAGVERIYFLSDVRFEVQRTENGKMVVQLTTSKPVREPFLNFLVEVIWPSGRLLREYALLIDPPIYGEEPVAPVQQVESAATLTTNQLPEIEVIDEAPSGQVSSTPIAQQSVAAAEDQQQGDVYGPTNNSDTMWAIALKVRPDSSVTAQQTMLAIQDMNPDSFINGNINSLKKGQILRLPSLNEIRQRSKRDAVRGVIAQNRDFENRALGKNVIDATPQSEAPTVDSAPEATNTGDELKLVVAENTASDNQSGAHAGEAANDGSAEALKNNLAVTLEKLDQASLEKEELNSRVEDLEEQLETLQRLLTLKDDQLANLQTQMGKDDVATQVDAVDQVVASDDAAIEGADVIEPEVVEADVNVANDPGVEAEKDMSDTVDADAAEKNIPKVADTAKPVTAPAMPKAKPVPLAVTEPVEEKITVQSIVDMVMKNPIYQLAVAGVVILLLIIVWGLSRRNAQKEQEFFETRNEDGEEPGDIFEVEDVLGEGASDDVATEIDDLDSTVDTELPTQPETEDVIAEADIYIAYGRLDQASQLLENAISSEPQRTDIRLKLLEVYAESNELESFDKQFNEVEALNDDYAMEQALEIKSRLADSDEIMSIDDLENQLLSGESETVVEESTQLAEDFETTEVEQSKDDIGTIDFEPTKIAEDQAGDAVDIDEELSTLESDLAVDGVGQSATESVEDDLDIDFDINEIDLDVDDSSLEESDSVEFDLDSEGIDALGSDESNAEEEFSLELDASNEIELDSSEQADELELEGELSDLDSELSDLDSELSDLDGELTDLDSELSDLDGELGEIELDPESETEERPSESSSLVESSGEDLEDVLNLDDLDLELDKIDSELDGNFDLEGSTDLTELEVEPADSDLLNSESTVEELEDIAEALSVDAVESEELDDALLEDDLASLEIDDVLVGEEGLTEPEAPAAVSLLDEGADDGLDIDDSILDLDENAVEEDGFESEITEDEDFDFLAGTDEAATKLDLARAYIDMGDGDGAKDILEEVALEGSEEQKQEAQDLLKTLD